MYPDLLRIGDFVISSFGLMLVLAFVGAYFQALWGMKRLEVGNEEDASALLFAAGIGGIVGAKVYYAILYRDAGTLLERSGLVWYGGLILGAAAVLWTMYRRRLPGWRTADAVAPGLALGYGIGRIGCFLVGDDYGVPTDLPWGVEFPRGLPASTAENLRRQFGVEVPPGVSGHEVLAVHPTQLYETAMALGIWGVGVWLLKRRAPTGTTALVVVALLAVERLVVEVFRAKDDRFLGPLTVAQALSLAILLVVAVLWFRRPRPGRVGPAAPQGLPLERSR